MPQVLCIRLKDSTVAILKKMARVDGKEMESRLAEVVEEMIALSQEEE
jgi:hypothetical protein